MIPIKTQLVEALQNRMNAHTIAGPTMCIAAALLLVSQSIRSVTKELKELNKNYSFQKDIDRNG